MSNDYLTILKESIIDLIRNCEDEDLLDLVRKLLVESGVEPQASTDSKV